MDTDSEKVDFVDSIYPLIDQLTSTDLNQFKFLCSDQIPVGDLEKMEITDIMQSLKKQRIVSDDEKNFIIESFILMGRKDLAFGLCHVDHFITELSNNLCQYKSIGGLNNFRILLFHLADNITQAEVKKLKFYFQDKLSISAVKIGKCITGFELLTLLKKLHYVHQDKLDKLIEMADKLNRKDLLEKIEKYKKNREQEANGLNQFYINPSPNRGKQENRTETNLSAFKFSSMDQALRNISTDYIDWKALIERVPENQRYSFCKELDISDSQYKHWFKKDKLNKLLQNCYEKDEFTKSDLDSAIRKFCPQNSPTEKSRPTFGGIERYKMTARPRGKCLIINNMNFSREDLHCRKGSSIDKDKLVKLFTSFHFEVEVFEDLTKEEMENQFHNWSSIDHTNFDCFVCAILSHGKEGEVFGTDGGTLSYQKIISFFKPSECQSLAGKPKLFFIQACQGKLYQDGIDLEADAQTMPSLPNEADFLIAPATVAGYVSFRSKSKGSWFIQTIFDVFSNNAETLDLNDMLLKVNNSISEYEGNLNNQIRKQVPAPMYTLRKKVYFLED